ncbi:MAG: D-cysteine desulfhydrase family protein [Anaerolineae bacterium]|nr:D-cysteine desulfhydrase family protein [Anaerolineae bacterium]
MPDLPFPRLRLGGLPTDLQPLPRLSQALGGPRLWVKRDDLTDLGGGNKVRPLEFLLADALRQRATHLVTFAGGAQSNHLRATAMAARRFGLEPLLIVFDDSPTARAQGNQLLNLVLGARVLYLGWLGKPDPRRTIEQSIRLMALLAAVYPGLAGPRRYVIPVGGFHPLGALGYVAAAAELADQAVQQGVRLDYVITPAGTGTTAAGLVAGFQWLGLPTKVIAIDVGRLWHDFPRSILRLAETTLRRLGRPGRVSPEALAFHGDYVGPGYAIPTVQGLNAIQWVARTEGLMLEPVYTSKAMGGLIDLIQAGRFSREDTVVFLHTGGLPALYAYNDYFRR